ncbi:hypothetical protein BJ742DRAFT_766038 [Cladochytrium replicatum]|nr:hypothetical protein BJ742DRAFT_766038 [Cladochytrium replicatum]
MPPSRNPTVLALVTAASFNKFDALPGEDDQHKAFDPASKNLWIGAFVLFFLWWIAQLGLYMFQMREPVIALAVERVDSTMTQKLARASKVARDCFTFMFVAAVMGTATGTTAVMGILGWAFTLLSVSWFGTSLYTTSPKVHVLASIATLPSIITFIGLSFSNL